MASPPEPEAIAPEAIEKLIAEWTSRALPPTLRSEPLEPVPAVDLRMLHKLGALDPSGETGILSAGIRSFVKETPDRLAALQAAAGRRDLAAVESTAHGLAGSCGLYGAFRMMALTAEIETRARGAREAGLPTLIHALLDEFEPVRAVLSKYLRGAAG